MCDHMMITHIRDPPIIINIILNNKIHHAIEVVLPVVKRSPDVKKKVSETTKTSCEKREKMKGRTQEQCDELQDQIRETRLNDFKNWVEQLSEKMEETNGQGDVRVVFKSVEALSGKRK